jgi:hypothetical protein
MAHSARECSSGAQALNMLREKASLNEGHGFSRAWPACSTASAAEVRFFEIHRERSTLAAANLATDDWKDDRRARTGCGKLESRNPQPLGVPNRFSPGNAKCAPACPGLPWGLAFETWDPPRKGQSSPSGRPYLQQRAFSRSLF